jgi:hypothetical protein
MTPQCQATFRSHRLAVLFYIIVWRFSASENLASGSPDGVLIHFDSMRIFSIVAAGRKKEKKKKKKFQIV